MKKLPEIIITGTPQELVEIEPLLVMAGYDEEDEAWNNRQARLGLELCNLHTYNDGTLSYINSAINYKLRLHAREIHKILHYIETGEIKEYIENPIDVAWHTEQLEYAEKHLNEKNKPTHTGQTKVVGKRNTSAGTKRKK